MNRITGAINHAATGLLIMPVSGHKVTGRTLCNIVDLPVCCCPISKNPRGGTLSLTYQPDKWVVEVYSLRELAQRFVGGFDATEHYPAERNMEGMAELIAQMVADAVGTDVCFRADVLLDCGRMIVEGEVSPQ
jgi:hypothetical protein